MGRFFIQIALIAFITYIIYLTKVKLTEGSELEIQNGSKKAQVLYMNSRALNEPVAWAGPIVMNTQEELREASIDLQTGNFIREELEFND